MREYVSARRVRSDFSDDHRGVDSLARTVHENSELVDIGVMDKNGDPIMARRKLDPIGFIHWFGGGNGG